MPTPMQVQERSRPGAIHTRVETGKQANDEHLAAEERFHHGKVPDRLRRRKAPTGAPIGQNRYGDNLYEDENGVRYTRGDGVKFFEDVAVAPDGRNKPVGRFSPDDRYQTADEVRANMSDAEREAASK